VPSVQHMIHVLQHGRPNRPLPITSCLCTSVRVARIYTTMVPLWARCMHPLAIAEHLGIPVFPSFKYSIGLVACDVSDFMLHCTLRPGSRCGRLPDGDDS